MEVYYKDLISEEGTLEKLVDDLTRLVQGADEFAQAAGVQLTAEKREELRTRLARLKEHCQSLKQQAFAGARATDKLLRKHPYASVGTAFVLGFAVGALVFRRVKR